MIPSSSTARGSTFFKQETRVTGSGIASQQESLSVLQFTRKFLQKEKQQQQSSVHTKQSTSKRDTTTILHN
jgi:hypothetical protein